MQIIRKISDTINLDLNQKQFVLSIGNFDGIHLGHQYLIKQNIQYAKENNLRSAILTFNPHPIKFLKPDLNFELLFDKNDCIEQLEKLGLDYLILQTFDKNFSLMPAKDFITELFSNIKIKAMILGPDFCFGLNRSGNLEYLMKESKIRQFQLIVPSAFKINEEIISTSGVKKKLKEGDLDGVSRYLGRNYYLKGEVIQGDQRGRLLGFPTANIQSVFAVHLKNGVYKTRTQILDPKNNINSVIYDSISNIGLNPTFNTEESQKKIETHIFDFNKDIYGQQIKIEFIKFIREEHKFNSKEALIKQIQSDIQEARKSF